MINGLQKLNQLPLAVANTELIWKMVHLFYLQSRSPKLNPNSSNYHLFVQINNWSLFSLSPTIF